MNLEDKLEVLQSSILKITSLYGTTGNNQKKELHTSFNNLKEAIEVMRCCVNQDYKETKAKEESNEQRKENFNAEVELLCEGIHSPDFTGKCFKCNEQALVKKQETKA